MVSYQWKTFMFIKCRGSTAFRKTKKNHGLKAEASKHLVDHTVACVKCGLGLSPSQCQSRIVRMCEPRVRFNSLALCPPPCLGIIYSHHFLPGFILPDFTKLVEPPWDREPSKRFRMSQDVSEAVIWQHHNGMDLCIFQTSSIAQTCANQKTWVMRDCERNSESSPSTCFFDRRLAVHH